MKAIIIFCLLVLMGAYGNAQLGVRYDPAVQATNDLQYFKPKGDLFVGDCIPFSRNGTYYYYWLLDSAHHKSLNGLGGHQWALSTTTDLVNWNEQLSYAISTDGIHFEKQKPNPFYTSAPGYSKRNFRDPKVFVDSTGEFHLLVSSEQEKPVLGHAAGCLVHASPGGVGAAHCTGVPLNARITMEIDPDQSAD